MPTRMAIVAMGRYGGFELGYGSDADVMFVHDPLPGRRPAAGRVDGPGGGQRRTPAAHRAGARPGARGRRRPAPEGRQGPLVRTLDSYAAYYGKWSAVWEAQALLRAAPIVGDPELRARFRELIDPLRFPEAGLTRDDVVEVRRIKARVDSERLPRGADPATHFKLGRGGLSDVEWTVQLLQMEHAGTVPELRTTKTLRGAAGGGRARPARRRATPRGWRRRGGSPAGRATRPCRCAASRRTSCPATPASGRRSRAILQYQPGQSDADGQRLPAGRPPGPRDRGPGVLGPEAYCFILSK